MNEQRQLALKPQIDRDKGGGIETEKKTEIKSERKSLSTQRGLRDSSKTPVVYICCVETQFELTLCKTLLLKNNREATTEGWTRRYSPRVLGELHIKFAVLCVLSIMFL